MVGLLFSSNHPGPSCHGLCRRGEDWHRTWSHAPSNRTLCSNLHELDPPHCIQLQNAFTGRRSHRLSFCSLSSLNMLVRD